MATAIPSRVLEQVMPQAGQPTLALKLGPNIKLGTLAIRAVNTTKTTGTFSFWVVPAGQDSPTPVNLEQADLSLEASASSVDFGYSLTAGDAVYVQGSILGIKFTVNGVVHES